MKNCDVAELGSLVRAIASVPGTFYKPALLDDSDSMGIGGLVGFSLKSVVIAAALDHEAVDHAMELRADVVAAFHVVEEIGDGLRRGVRIQLDLDDTRGRVELDLRIGGERGGGRQRDGGGEEIVANMGNPPVG